MKAGLIGFVWLGALAAISSAQDVTIKPAGLQLIWDSAKDEFGGFATYNQAEGATVSLIATATKGQIIDVPEQLSQITLGGVKAKAFFTAGEARQSTDRTKVRVEFTAAGQPKVDEKGALPVEGKLVLTTASKKEEVKSEALKFEKNATVVFPETAKLPIITIESAGKPKYGNGAWEVVLAANGDLEGIAEFRFVDKSGQVIEAKRGGWTRSSMFGKTQVSLRLALTKPIEEGTLVIDLWTDRNNVEIPLSLKLGMTGPL